MSAYEGSKMQEADEDRRRAIVELTAADIRKLIGAPTSAVVEVTPEIDHGPNGKTEARIHVSWREGA